MFLTALKNKVVVAGVLVALLAGAGAGWAINGWRLDNRAAQLALRTQRAFDARLAAEMRTWADKNAALLTQNTQLSEDLGATRNKFDRLQQEVNHAPLLPPPRGPVSNIFSPEFVRLWNAAADTG